MATPPGGFLSILRGALTSAGAMATSSGRGREVGVGENDVRRSPWQLPPRGCVRLRRVS